MEEVRNSYQVAFVCARFILFIIVATTKVYQQMIVFTEFLIYIKQEIKISCSILIVLSHIVTLRLREQTICRSVELTFEISISIINTCTSDNVKPIGDVPLHRKRYNVSISVSIEHITVYNPIRVLHTQSLVLIRPILSLEVSIRIITFVNYVFVHVIARWKQINRNQRVVVHTLSVTVLIVLFNIEQSHIHAQNILNDVPRITESEVIAIIFIVIDNTFRIYSTERDMSLVSLSTGRQRNRVHYIESCLEEI